MFKAQQNDADLWLSICNDDGYAFDVLFKRYWARLYKVAFNQLKDEEISLEIVHDVFISLWNRRKDLEIHTLQNFLLTAIKYQVYKRLRTPKLSIAYRAEFNEEDALSELNLGEINIRDHELQQKLNTYLNQLPKRCHEIFQLSRVEHLSNQEIAERLGITKKSVENQLTVALKHLRHAFKDIASLVVLTMLLK